MVHGTKEKFILGNRCGNSRLIECVARGQNMGWRGFAEEEIDKVEETTNAVGVGRSDRYEGDRYTTRDASRILDVKVL